MSPKKKAARKKTAKKKVVKRKPVKRRAARKKKSAALPPLTVLRRVLMTEAFLAWLKSMGLVFNPFTPDKCVTVRFYDKGGLNHEKARRSSHDRVCFENLGKVDRTLTLDHWPFTGPATTIFVAAGTTEGEFELNPDDKFEGTITITADPAFDSSGGPGDPQFDAGN